MFWLVQTFDCVIHFCVSNNRSMAFMSSPLRTQRLRGRGQRRPEHQGNFIVHMLWMHECSHFAEACAQGKFLASGKINLISRSEVQYNVPNSSHIKAKSAITKRILILNVTPRKKGARLFTQLAQRSDIFNNYCAQKRRPATSSNRNQH
jgi:hypothetical protein